MPVPDAAVHSAAPVEPAARHADVAVAVAEQDDEAEQHTDA